jgi:hypothetical protein
MSHQISLRLFAEVADESEASVFANEVRSNLLNIGSIQKFNVRRYAKVPEFFEVHMVIDPIVEPPRAFESILSTLGEGWDRNDVSVNEQWAVLNTEEGGKFHSPVGRWASVDRVPEPS